MKNLIRRRYLHRLSISHKKEATLMWVNSGLYEIRTWIWLVKDQSHRVSIHWIYRLSLGPQNHLLLAHVMMYSGSLYCKQYIPSFEWSVQDLHYFLL